MRLDPRNAVALLVTALVIGSAGVGLGQTPPPATTEPPPKATEAPAPQGVAGSSGAAGPAIEARQLDTFLLRDSKGSLVPVLGMSFDEFEQLLKLKKGLAPPPPPGFTFDALSVTGTVAKGVADLQITLTVRLREDEWVGVPLAMKSAVLREAPRYEGPGEHFVVYDHAADGFQAWFRGAGTKPHVLTIHAAVSLTTVGDETRLALPLPRATESALRLTVPLPRCEAALAVGEGLVSTAPKGEQSEISVLGPAGDLQLTWRKAREATVAGPVLLDSGGEIVVKIESESRISSDARLRVRSLGAPLSSFQVRLPAGMELVPTSPVGYAISVVSPPSDAGGGRSAIQFPLVEVRLDRPTTTTAEVRLLATTPAAGGLPANLTPARFDVLGAVRQRGTIDFVVEGEWQLGWNDDPTVRRLDSAADAAAAKLAARFEYSRQPCGLLVRVAPRPSRVSVEPLHVVEVEPRLIRIATTLKYRLRGSRAEGLTFHVGDLRFDRLAPEDLLDAPEPIGADGVLRVPFRQGIALPPELELKLETHHPLAEGANQFAITFPRPLADSVAPATVVIWPADNVELTPQTGLLLGLTPDASPAPPALAPHQQRPLVYRDLGGAEPAQFGGLLKVNPRSTLVSAAASVRMEKQQLQIEQRLLYRIAHEPKRSFVLVAPRAPLTSGGLSVWSGEDQLGVQSLADPPAKAATHVRLQFSLPGDQIGLFPVTIRYALPLPRWDGQKPLPVAIPLVLPEDEPNYQFAGQEITFEIESGLQVEPDLTGVDEFSRPTASANNASLFTWSKAAATSRWIIQPLRDTPSALIACDKAWIQTWLTPKRRQERAAFRLTSSADFVSVRLPPGAELASVQEAAINAQAVAFTTRAPAVLRVELPPAQRGRSCVLEIWYSLPAPDRRGGWLAEELQTAVLEQATPPRRSYWQLVLTANDQLVWSSPNLASEMAWQPGRWFAGPQPLLDQRRLEEWIECSRQDPLPAGASAYLFGTLAQSPRLPLVVASRRLVLIIASGLALALGLSLIYLPVLHRATPLMLAAIALGGLSLAFPDAALLLGRAALLGLAVTAAVGIWRWLAWGPTFRADSRSTITAANAPATSSTTQPRPERESPLTTATAPAALAGEPHP